MFGKIFGFTKAVVKCAVPVVITIVAPGTLINLVGGAVIKHVIPSVKINKAIPYISIGTTIAAKAMMRASETDIMTAGTEGLVQAMLAWAAHRSIKAPLRGMVKNPLIAGRVGPGDHFSI